MKHIYILLNMIMGLCKMEWGTCLTVYLMLLYIFNACDQKYISIFLTFDISFFLSFQVKGKLIYIVVLLLPSEILFEPMIFHDSVILFQLSCLKTHFTLDDVCNVNQP